MNVHFRWRYEPSFFSPQGQLLIRADYRWVPLITGLFVRQASVKTKKRERENDEDKVLFLKKGEDMEEYAVLDALEQLLRKKRRRDVEDRVLELQDRLKDLQKRKARRRHEMLDLSVLGVPALRVKGPDLKGSDSDSDGEPAPEDGAELVQSKKKFQRLRHTTEDDSGDDDDLMQDL